MAFEFIAKHYPSPCVEVYLPNPTWPVHRTICSHVGLKYKSFRYYDPKTKGLDFQGLLEDIDKAPNA